MKCFKWTEKQHLEEKKKKNKLKDCTEGQVFCVVWLALPEEVNKTYYTYGSAHVNSALYPLWDAKWVSAFGLSNNDKWRLWLWTTAAYRWTHSPSKVAWSEGRRPFGAVVHSSNKLSELSQWHCGHNDSTISIVLVIIIIIIKVNWRNVLE